MKTGKKLRLISLIMLAVAVVFVCCNPALGQTVWIGPFEFGVKQWRVCCTFYVSVMIQLFVMSFFVKDRK